MPQDARALISQLARRYGIDPSAALAVARGEGGLVNRQNDRGDGGRSFGPFQLFEEGALPRNLVGRRDRADAWAWSPEGISYALQRMAQSGAKGLKGRQAVETIIRRFERPRDPDTSVANAIARLSSSQVSAPTGTPSAGVPGPGPGEQADPRRAFAQKLLQSIQEGRGLDTNQMLEAVQARRQAIDAQPAAAAASPIARELTHTAGGGVNAGSPEAMLAIIREAQRRGLAVRENPFVDPVDPVHTEGSHHYRRFKDNPKTRFDESKLGRGADISGNGMAAFFDWVAGRYPQIAELIFDPRGSIFDGRRSTSPYGGHGTHVHVGL